MVPNKIPLARQIFASFGFYVRCTMLNYRANQNLLWPLLILFALCLVTACNRGHKLKPGYNAFSRGAVDQPTKFKEKLAELNIPFYTYMLDKTEFIAFPTARENEAYR